MKWVGENQNKKVVVAKIFSVQVGLLTTKVLIPAIKPFLTNSANKWLLVFVQLQIILSVVVKLVTLSPFYGQTLSFQSMGLFPSAASSSYYCQCHILCCRKSYPVLHRVLHPSIDLTTIVDKLFTYFYTWTNILFAATSM